MSRDWGSGIFRPPPTLGRPIRPGKQTAADHCLLKSRFTSRFSSSVLTSSRQLVRVPIPSFISRRDLEGELRGTEETTKTPALQGRGNCTRAAGRLANNRFSRQIDIRVRVTGGGHTSQVYAVRQAISKALIAYYQKYVDEHSKNLLKQALTQFDRTLLVADNRRCEPKKFGGKGARSRFQKSYR